MKIYEYPKTRALQDERVIALGFFDGVHAGHRRLFARAKALSKELNIPSAVFTFHSETALPKSASERLYCNEDKLSLIEECGIDEIIIADFEKIKNVDAEDFVKRILIDSLGCRAAVCGRDFRFGKMAKGDASLLCKILSEYEKGFFAEEDVIIGSKKASTTEIKAYLSRGEIEKANEMLGSPYFVKAETEHGRGVGRTLGFPTVNSNLGDHVAFLRTGVYKTEVEICGVRYPALTNIGRCPTFGDFPTHAETFILNFNSDLYGKTVKIFFHSFIRDEKKFSGTEELAEQIKKDIKAATNN